MLQCLRYPLLRKAMVPSLNKGKKYYTLQVSPMGGFQSRDTFSSWRSTSNRNTVIGSS